MTKVILVCVAFLNVACISAGERSASGEISAFDQFVRETIKAQTSNDAHWLEANLAEIYVEGTSFGTWIRKAELIKDVKDLRNNKFTKNDISDVEVQVVGNVGLARFKQSYDATIQGQHRARTIICSMTAVKQGSWKVLSTHCSKIEQTESR